MKPVIWRITHLVILLGLLLFPFSTKAWALSISLDDAVDNSLTWTTGGDAEWFGQTSVYYFDTDAAQSGDMPGGTGRSSWIRTTVEGPGIISFYWRVSDLSAVNDLSFYLDGAKKLSCWAYDNWEMQTYSIPTGSHTLEWDYAPVIHASGEAGFLDYVAFASSPAIVVQEPNGLDMLYHRNFYNINWASTEDSGLNVRLELYKGENWLYTISNNTENDGEYSWFVPFWLDPGSDYHIHIVSISNIGVYGESENFSISNWYQSSFGGFLMLDGDDDYAIAEDHNELDVGDEPGESFTLEAWFNMQESSISLVDRQHILNKSNSYDLYAVRYYDYGTSSYRGCIGFSSTLSSDEPLGVEHCKQPAFSLGWHHVALVFYSGSSTARFYLDGQAFGNPYSVGSAIKNTPDVLYIGDNLNGAVDEMRISNMERYTGDYYAIPTSPFTCDDHTRALWHFDGIDGAINFHDTCGADNMLVGYNGAHIEGIPARKIYLPLVIH